jgi:SAM-dependent methyltransferase
MGLEKRELGRELTDDLELATEEVGENLLEIEKINKWLGGHQVSISGIETLLLAKNSHFTLADYGSGGGDTLRGIARKFSGSQPHLTGIDGNSYTVKFARRHTPKNMPIRYQEADIFSEMVKSQEFDIIHSSLTCHHFSREKLVQLFRQMKKNSRLGFVINDLHRHPLALAGIKFLNGLLVKTELGKHDGVQSVRRGFTRAELIDILHEAGITNYRLHWKWAFRWLLVVPKH